ncbi:MAG TPA: hypothetical protein VMZ74_11635 [Ramlibacter sp.]|nr:hypothetical protein [Ramlibacter sp.]
MKHSAVTFERFDEQRELVQSMQQACSQASQAERARWEVVKGRYPGQPGHDPQAWGEWLRAASTLRDAAARLRGVAQPR